MGEASEGTTGARNITESLKIAIKRMNIDGTITAYPKHKGGRIASWMEKFGWKADTPLKEGGIKYPIWPKKRPQQKNKAKDKKIEKISLVRGPTLEEEMDTPAENRKNPKQ